VWETRVKMEVSGKVSLILIFTQAKG